MRISRLLVFIILMITLPTMGAKPADDSSNAKGALIVEKKTIAIRYAAIADGPSDLILVLTDNPMPPKRVPFGIYDMTQKGQVQGLALTIDKATKKLTDGNLHHMAWDGQLGGLADSSTLEIRRLDSEVVEGRIFTPVPVTFDEKSYSFDVTFSVKIVAKEPPKVTVTGSSSPAATAYATYYKALFAGDLPGARALITSAGQKGFDDMASANIAGFIRVTRPATIAIVSSSLTAGEELLAVHGTLLDADKNGSVIMVLEKGAWKVKKDSWK